MKEVVRSRLKKTIKRRKLRENVEYSFMIRESENNGIINVGNTDGLF